MSEKIKIRSVETLSLDKIREVLLDLSYNHSITTQHGKTLSDYRGTFDLYRELIAYTALNWQRLSKTNNIAGTYGQMTEQLLIIRAAKLTTNTAKL